MRARNPVALLFYRELGFEETGRVPRYYSGREDALRLAKDLRHPLARAWPDAGLHLDGADRGQAPGPSAAQWLATHFPKDGSPA